jgi:outer membrane protein OmpA-like peptidoglycan-associated protein
MSLKYPMNTKHWRFLMKTNMKVLFLFLLLFVISVNSFALMTTLTIKGGVSRYQGDVNDDIDLYPAGAISFEVWMTKFLSLGIQPYYGYLAAGETPDYAFETHAGGADVLLKLRPFAITLGDGAINKIAPYIIGGGGMVNYFPIVDQATGIGIPLSSNYNYNMPNDKTKYNAQVYPTIGGGITFMTKHNMNIDLGVQFNNTKTDFLDGAEGGKKNDTFMLAYLGLAFNFGVNKDTDGDGILNKYDADPTHPEDFDGFEDKDGAPDPDNDNDGIPDISDKAPGTDETVANGINTKEDMDGFQDTDGIPDPDNDNDGIPDVNDKAPGTDETLRKGINTKETYNGYQDTDGVPDEVPVAVKEEPKPTPPPVVVEKPKPVEIELHPVYFALGSDELTKADREILDPIYKSLKANPDINIEINGYTDNVGTEDANMRLSKLRAEEVMWYFVQRGLDKKRFLVKANGWDNPAASNDTAEGRAMNRRAELSQIK